MQSQASQAIYLPHALPQKTVHSECSNILLDSEDNFSNEKAYYFSLQHKDTLLPVRLSLQRRRCLSYLMQGKLVKEIAHAMNLAPKTIEHYLEFLRKKLGCRSSKELIACYGEQFERALNYPQ